MKFDVTEENKKIEPIFVRWLFFCMTPRYKDKLFYLAQIALLKSKVLSKVQSPS